MITTKPVEVFPELPAAHLPATAKLNETHTRPRPLANIPKFDTIHELLVWLNVENSTRYKATPTQTFCNIYAYDYCYARGVYLPRVWWTSAALKSREFKVAYGKTVTELNVNALTAWLKDFGHRFNWKEVELQDAQQLANNGMAVIALSANKNRARSGHITCIVPETESQKADTVRDVVMNPLQSHAGTRNEMYMNRRWHNSTLERVQYWACE